MLIILAGMIFHRLGKINLDRKSILKFKVTCDVQVITSCLGRQSGKTGKQKTYTGEGK